MNEEDFATATRSSKGCDPKLNESTEASAIKCLQQQGIFYDGCSHRCEREMSFLRLSQGFELEHFVYGYIFPTLVVLVVVANVLVVLVLSQKQMISPTNVVLKYMAIADLCVGLVPLPWNFFYHTLRNYEHEDQLELWWCYMYKYSMDAIPPVCHNVAMWLTVLLASQRYISIQYPLKSRHICTVRNVRIVTIVITILSFICGLPKSLDYYFYVYDGWAYVEPRRFVQLRSCLSGFTRVVKMVGSNTFFNAYFWTRVFGFIVLPSLLLICLNALLIRNIRTAQKRKERLLKEKRAREAQRQIDNNSTSIMLVIIVSIFLLVNLPQAFFMAMLCVCNTFGISIPLLEGLFPAVFLLVSNMLVMATYPINFGIYCFMSSSFRDTFRMIFYNEKTIRDRYGSQMGRGCSEFTRLSGARRSDPSLNVAPKLSLGNSGTEPNISAASMQTTNSCPAAVKTANKLLNCSQQQQQQLLPLTLRDDTTTTKGKGEEEDEVPLNLSENTNNKVVNGFCGDGSVNELSSTTTSDAERQQLIGGVSPTSTSPGGETIFL